jgi:hypothetical protein
MFVRDRGVRFARKFWENGADSPQRASADESSYVDAMDAAWWKNTARNMALHAISAVPE